jgi:hypothetical protein
MVHASHVRDSTLAAVPRTKLASLGANIHITQSHEQEKTQIMKCKNSPKRAVHLDAKIAYFSSNAKYNPKLCHK